MKLITLMTLLTLVSCGRDAEKLLAPKNAFDFQNDFSTFGTRGGSLENFYKFDHNSTARDATVVVYPNDADMDGFDFVASAERKASWDAVYSKFNETFDKNAKKPRYSPQIAKKLKRQFGASLGWTGQETVKHMVNWINTVGMVRDDAHRDRGQDRLTLMTLGPEVDAEIIKSKEKEAEIVAPFPCHYIQRNKCKTESFSDGGNNSRLKTPKKCRDISRFSFTFDDPAEQTAFDQRFDAAKTACTEEQDRYDREIRPKLDRLNDAEDRKRPFDQFREDAKSVVLDILEQAENYSKVGYIGALSTMDKELSCPAGSTQTECVSKLVFSHDKKTVKEFKLFMDFGSWIPDGEKIKTGLFSIENKGIRNLNFYKTAQGSLVLEFDLVYEDQKLDDGDGSLVLRAKLSMTDNAIDPFMGLRFVGETEVFYADGSMRKGVMKLEFDRR